MIFEEKNLISLALNKFSPSLWISLKFSEYMIAGSNAGYSTRSMANEIQNARQVLRRIHTNFLSILHVMV